jgi:methylated-DNA-[protein]-cysteine S-methyltransferase
MSRSARRTVDPVYFCKIGSSLGPVLLSSDGHGLSGLWFEGQKHAPAIDTHWMADDSKPAFRETLDQLQAYAAGRLQVFDLPLALKGTAFQLQVWNALLEIAPGSTCSYAQLARRIGTPRAMRAVGAAVGRNPVSIIVPCHRVLGSDGSLTGYAGGLSRKQALLGHEGVLAADLLQERQTLSFCARERQPG